MSTTIEHNEDRPDWNKWWSEKFEQHSLLYKAWYYFLWKAYESLLSYVNLSPKSQVLELGCGSGQISLLIAKKYRCNVTLVDNSNNAITQATKLFKNHNISARFVHTDMFRLSLQEEFDLVHSEGVIEHFHPRAMKRSMLIHRNAARKGGYVITFAPTTSLFYLLTVWIMKATDNWYFGYEAPISVCQHIRLYKEAGLRVIKHTGVLFREVGLLGERI